MSHALGNSDVQRASEICDPKPIQVAQEILTPYQRKKQNLSHHHPAFPLVVKIT